MELRYYKCSKCGMEEVDMKQFNVMMKKNDFIEKNKVKPLRKVKLDFSKLH